MFGLRMEFSLLLLFPVLFQAPFWRLVCQMTSFSRGIVQNKNRNILSLTQTHLMESKARRPRRHLSPERNGHSLDKLCRAKSLSLRDNIQRLEEEKCIKTKHKTHSHDAKGATCEGVLAQAPPNGLSHPQVTRCQNVAAILAAAQEFTTRQSDSGVHFQRPTWGPLLPS